MLPIRRGVTLLLTTLLLASCQGGALTGAGAPAATGARFNQLQFGPSSSSTTVLPGLGMGMPATPTAPMAAGTTSAMPTFGAPSSALSGMVGLMALASLGSQGVEVTEAKTRGYTGSMRDAMEQVVQPILTDWAKDAAVQMAMGAADRSGQNRAAAASSSAPQGWVFVASSPSRNETLMFNVTGSETQVVRMTIPRTHIDMAGVTLSSGDVISKVAAAVADPTAKGTEAAPAPAGPGSLPNLSSIFANFGGMGGEEVFAVSESSNWMLLLTQEWPEKTRSRLVWVAMEVSGSAPAGGYQTPTVARLDAATGQILTLQRPRRVGVPTPVSQAS